MEFLFTYGGNKMKKIRTTNNYILKGKKPVVENDVLKWGKWFETAKRIVKQETLSNGYWISTVFLGLDHNFGEGKPLLFETMVFSKDKWWWNYWNWFCRIVNKWEWKKRKYSELDMDRYSTWEEAERGHKKMVKKWKKKGGKNNKKLV